jgi:hypothetical protein
VLPDAAPASNFRRVKIADADHVMLLKCDFASRGQKSTQLATDV